MKVRLFLFLGILMILTIPLSLVAQNKTTHTIKKGETLFSIAKKYNVDIEQLKKWNDITTDQLSIGNTLVVKRGSEDHKEPASTDRPQTHTVKDNETLFSISKKYQVTIAELKSWNNLSSNNLNVGQKLKIFPSESADQPEQSVTTDKEVQQNSYYVVKNNDSLYGIARKHGMSVDQLKSLNNLSSNTIQVGQKLTVSSTSSTPSVSSSNASSAQGKFMTHTVKEGSISIADLAEKFQMDVEELRALNNGLSTSTLRRGQEVSVLAPASKNFKNPYLKNSRSMTSLGTVKVSRYSQKPTASTTTSGELYNPDALTGAHASIALGTVIFVQNTQSDYGVFVRINDRISGNDLKVSKAAWKALHLSDNNKKATIYQNK